MRVLIVEDEISHRMLLQRYLRDVCSADVAVNGREAVDAFRLAMDEGDPYSLILLDLEMPEMNGQEALLAMRDIEASAGVQPGRETKVLVITAHNDQKKVCDAFFKGNAAGYLVKPAKESSLLGLIEELGVLPH